MSLRSRTAPRLLINVITISDRRVSPSGRSFTFWAISLPVCAHVVAANPTTSMATTAIDLFICPFSL